MKNIHDTDIRGGKRKIGCAAARVRQVIFYQTGTTLPLLPHLLHDSDVPELGQEETVDSGEVVHVIHAAAFLQSRLNHSRNKREKPCHHYDL